MTSTERTQLDTLLHCEGCGTEVHHLYFSPGLPDGGVCDFCKDKPLTGATDADDERLRIDHPFRWRWWKIEDALGRLNTRIRSWIAGA